jgi:amino acid transporter
MPQTDVIVLVILGCVFIILGIALMIWGKKEETNYYNTLSTRPDTREFMEHWPGRPQFGALKIGGWIAVAIGLLMLIWGLTGWLSG